MGLYYSNFFYLWTIFTKETNAFFQQPLADIDMLSQALLEKTLGHKPAEKFRSVLNISVLIISLLIYSKQYYV